MHVTTNHDERSGWMRRVGAEIVQTLSIASQMALICPSGMDEWTKRELAGSSDRDRLPSRAR